jgi:predicted porin
VPGTTTRSGRDNTKADAAFNRRQGNSVQYWSPDVYGLSARVAYSVAEGRTASSATAPSLAPTVASGLVTYQRGPFALRYAYERHDDYFGIAQIGGSQPGMANRSSTDEGHLVMASVDLPTRTRLMGLAERLSYSSTNKAPTAIKSYTRDEFTVLAQQRLGSHMVWGEYGQALDGDAKRVDGGPTTTNGLGATQWSVGYVYSLGKSTDLFASYYEIQNERSASYGPMTMAGSANLSSIAPGSTVRGFGVGLLYTFKAAWNGDI